MTTEAGRTLRADATRNRDLLLSAAEEEFAERGLNASVADIARRAGIAKGTVFRHFSTKDDLIAAIVKRHIEALIELAQDKRRAADPGQGLFDFLVAAADRHRQRDLTFLLTASADDDTVTQVSDRLHAEITALVERAQAGGALRADVTGTDVFLLICAPVHIAGNLRTASSDLWLRYLGIIFDGLRPEGAAPLPHPPPRWE